VSAISTCVTKQSLDLEKVRGVGLPLRVRAEAIYIAKIPTICRHSAHEVLDDRYTSA
jgi:hypothetical protein